MPDRANATREVYICSSSAADDSDGSVSHPYPSLDEALAGLESGQLADSTGCHCSEPYIEILVLQGLAVEVDCTGKGYDVCFQYLGYAIPGHSLG